MLTLVKGACRPDPDIGRSPKGPLKPMEADVASLQLRALREGPF